MSFLSGKGRTSSGPFPTLQQQQNKEQAVPPAVIPISPPNTQLQRKDSSLSPDRDPIYLWSSLVAGVGSGALSSVFCAPLDLIRTRLQVWGDLKLPTSSVKEAFLNILATEGWRGCFRGLGASLATVPAFWGVYFPLYDDLKRHWRAAQPDTNLSVIHMGSAVAAGAVSDVICNPMFVVRTRLQTEALHNLSEGIKGPSSGIVGTIRLLYAEGGIPVFWRGMTANLMGLSHVAVQFPVYEWLKTSFVKAHQKQLQKMSAYDPDVRVEPTPMDLFLASGLSKMTASLLTYPHEVIRSRMMDARGSAGMTFRHTIEHIYRHEGVLGFYSGLPVALVRVIPNCCITFMTYELLLRWAKRQIRERRAAGDGRHLQ